MPRRLFFVGLALLVCFLAAIVNATVPLRLTEPRWHLALVSALLSNGPLALIGLLITDLGLFLDPTQRTLPRRVRRVRRFGQFALAAALGFLLLIPLQIAAQSWSVSAVATAQNQNQAQSLETITKLQQTISSASNYDDLEDRLDSLQIPLTNPPDRQTPFPQYQQKVLSTLRQSQERVSQASRPPTSMPRREAFFSALRIIPTALALAFAFAILGLLELPAAAQPSPDSGPQEHSPGPSPTA